MSGVLHALTMTSSTGAADPLLASNVLLLKTIGTNNATNASFVDSSSNNFTVTRTGDVTQGAFSPYAPTGYWSNYFDGTGDRITAAHNAAFRLTGDFTVECWVNFVAVAGRANWLMGCLEFSNETGWMFRYTGTALRFYAGNLGAMDRSWTPTLGVWYHLAVTRSSDQIRMFIDGVQQGAAVSNSTSFSASTALATVGGDPNFGSDTNAFISNARVVNGTAVYTANFTPPTTPLTAISGTSLLTCQDNRFIDRSSNNFTLTQVGDVSVRRFAPFGLSWDSSLGGSAYFNQPSNDRIQTTNNDSFRFGTGDFCVEAWLYPSDTTPPQGIASIYGGWSFQLRAGAFQVWNFNANLMVRSYTTKNSWVHVAWTRSGTSMRIFVNGVQQGATVTDSTNFTGGGTDLTVGDLTSAIGFLYTGYMSDLRIVKGSAVYTSNFALPTVPLTAITNTSLLLSFNNAAVYDATRSSNFTLNGTTQTSTAQKNYADTSVALSTAAAGNRGLQTVDRPELRFGTGDFTAELWWRPSVLSGYQTIINKGYGSTGGLALQSNANRIEVYVNGSTFTAPANRVVTNNAWNHIALVRSAGTVTLWVNGLSAGSVANSANLSITDDLLIGWETQGGNIYPATGNVEDVRFSRTARYTSAFTPPTRALPVTAG